MEVFLADTLLVSIAIGEKYLDRYKTLFYGNHRAYADQCGYDLEVVADYLDPANRHPSFISLQKSLVCSQEFSAGYKRIVYVDADILFNLRKADPIHLVVRDDTKVYIADEYTQPTPELRLRIQQACNWEASAEEYYRLAGLELKTASVLNTGMMIFNPEAHRPLLEEIYRKTIATGYNHPRGFHYEQAMIGYGLQTAGCYRPLPNEWNAIWMLHKMGLGEGITLAEFFAANKAVHFAGNYGLEEVPALLAASGQNEPRSFGKKLLKALFR